MLNIKGHEIKEPMIKDSFSRRSVQLKNAILTTLKLLSVDPDSVEIVLEPIAMKKARASVSWYFEGHNLYYSYALLPKFVENLFVVSRILELEVAKLLNEEISLDDFFRTFSEDKDVEQQRIEARELLGIASDEQDLEVISKQYKELAKEHHPDMPNGDHEMFKKINRAHKLLKRELS